MIGELRTWIINICTAIIFITAVEMILPNNSFKKYAKFVLGLILITVLINPVIKVFNNGINISDAVTKTFTYVENKEYENNIDKYKEESMKNTMSVFKLNLEETCAEKLKQQFPKNYYKIDADVEYDEKSDSVLIKSLKVGIKDGSVEKVKKVVISTKGNIDDSVEQLTDERSKLVREYLSKELKISSQSIMIYKEK